MARRKRFTAKDRARIFAAHNGICHLCRGKIQDNEAWELEHIIAWALTQDDSDENLAPAHVKCHKAKTHKQDRPAINKAVRLDNKRRGFVASKKKLQSRGFGYPKKQPLIDKSKLPFGIGARDEYH
jgi:5-methylcytosine-specific restriction protein A